MSTTPRLVFVDVGGHKGQTLDEVLSGRYAFDVVHTLEPMADFADGISRNYRQHIEQGRLVVHAYGLSNHNGETALFGDNRGGGASVHRMKGADGHEVKESPIRVMRASEFIDRHIANNDILVMKLNCEGSEGDILVDLLDSERIHRIANVMIDFDLFKVRGSRHIPFQVIRRLREAGFANYHLAQDVMVGPTHQDRIRNWLSVVDRSHPLSTSTHTFRGLPRRPRILKKSIRSIKHRVLAWGDASMNAVVHQVANGRQGRSGVVAARERVAPGGGELRHDSEMDLDFTGEFFVPGKSGERIEADHLERYRFACKYARNKKVLDIACGVGYAGPLFIAAGAASYEGVDLNEQLVDHASQRYRSDRIVYHAGDICTFNSGRAFDLITCFETIEHVEDYQMAIRNLYALLNPGGTLLISSPNRTITSPRCKALNDKPSNRFHVREFVPGELREALRNGGFNSTQEDVFGQRQRTCVYSRRFRKIAYAFFGNPDLITSPEVTKVTDKAPRYFVVVATKKNDS